MKAILKNAGLSWQIRLDDGRLVHDYPTKREAEAQLHFLQTHMGL